MSTAAAISALAQSLMAGEQTPEAALARAERTLGRHWRWLKPLSLRYVEAFNGHTRPRHRDVVQFLLEDSKFHRARVAHRDKLSSVAEWIQEPPAPCAN